MTYSMKSQRAQRALDQMAQNLKTARLKRRISVQDLADRVGVSTRTIMRLEKGDEGVRIGTLAMACLVLGEIERVSNLLDPASDDTALLLERSLLPKRIAAKRNKASSQIMSDEQVDSGGDRLDEDGVSF